MESKSNIAHDQDFVGDLPDLPSIEGIKDEEMEKLRAWWFGVRTVLRRQQDFINDSLSQ